MVIIMSVIATSVRYLSLWCVLEKYGLQNQYLSILVIELVK